ncbi:SUMF1/EgtB/PvdO family nonheme iron enzyme [Bradyrhizobium sp.]|uniref:SUMF1/EgtB/PvdO family nonheme iron enzyme n=1 Tax=Bradyrhizobium sp. TaxID=376 RepID=UPI001EC48458|nr:SUMF1/EgtB/PvdO family nonheme iron enzyme [Bradyrhizobium sp.]MBV8920157.1 SUMF1/EgtB/PvdO family nonheme iron enzyme [Bradyrhizobium sp.]MBV9980507.1 SUMF1/EgtB/PvdO family nonheme iron enzyme [Bradyrhizobium sp.]
MTIEDQLLERLHAPAAGRDDPPMVTVTQSVPCERCGRIVRVAMSALRPPSFDQIDEQVECPEIQERRGKGEGGLLLMMCSSLKRSLDAGCESVEVIATPRDDGDSGQVVCRIPGVSSTYYSADEARGRAEIWDAHGHTKLAARLRAAAVKAERQRVSRARVAIGVGAMAIVVAGGWFALLREPQLASPPPPAQQFSETSDASPSPAAVQPAPDTSVSQPASAATEAAPVPSRDAPTGAVTRSLSSDPSQSQAVEPEPPTPSPAQDAAMAADATSPAESAPAAAAAPNASPTPSAEKVHLPDLVMIPGGTFAMGGVEVAELPVHQVTVKPFALGKFPVTIGEWKECVADQACAAELATGADDNPVSNVSYDDAKAYLAWLSKVVGKPFRLPTEAEWEYAARGGKSTRFWWGDQMRPGMANCKGCNDTGEPAQLMKVGGFNANPFGLFDMGGCVDQWVADSWHRSYQGAPADGSAWVDEDGFARVIRSGSWKNDASYVRAGSRDHYDARVRYPTHGFRVALSLEGL